MEDERNEIDTLRKGLQQFNQLRHEDHYQLQSLLDHNLKKIISLINNLPRKLSENIEEGFTRIKEDLSTSMNELINTIKENPNQIVGRLSVLEETINAKLENTVEHIKTLDSHLGELSKSTFDLLKERAVSIEEELKNTTEQLNKISENMNNYIGEFKKEREEFESTKRKEEAKIMNDRAVKHFYAGRNSIAIESLKRAARLDDSSLEILTNLGIVLSMEKSNKEAQKIFQSVLEKDPNMVEALSGMGLVMFNEGDIDGAIGIFKQAIEKDEGVASAYANLGFAYKEKNDINKAVENWEKAIKLNPGLIDVKEALSLYKDRRVDGTGEISV